MLLTQSNTFIIGWVEKLLGYIMELIYTGLSSVGIVNLGICIIVFTLVVKLAMLPLTIKQQKFSKINLIMQPEINKIQKKYRNKRDQASMIKQNEEIQAVYEKYGVSPSGSYLQLLIQMPIIFALYGVIRKLPAYIPQVKELYQVAVDSIMSVGGFEATLTKIGESAKVITKIGENPTSNQIIDFLTELKPDAWNELANAMPSVTDVITSQYSTISDINNFMFGINIGEYPSFSKPIYLIIPIAAGLFQWLSMKTMNTNVDDNPQLAAMNKTMMFMPLMSVIFCFSVPAGVGMYWAISALFQVIQQIAINKYMDKIDVDKMIEKNRIKASKKKKKKKSLTTRMLENASGQSSSDANSTQVRSNTMSSKARLNTKNMGINYEDLYPLDSIQQNKIYTADSTTKKGKKSKKEKETGGSIAANANLMRTYNEQHGKGGK